MMSSRGEEDKGMGFRRFIGGDVSEGIIGGKNNN